MSPEGLATRIYETVLKAKAGELEARVTHIVPGHELEILAWSVNDLLDRIEILLRETIISVDQVSKQKTLRWIDSRGFEGSFRETVDALNASLNAVQNLEKNLVVREEEAQGAHAKVKMILENLGQAFVMVDGYGEVREPNSFTTQTLFDCAPYEKSIHRILNLDAEEEKKFLSLLQLMFAGQVSFDSLTHLAPSSLINKKGRYIELSYRGVRDKGGHLTKLIVIGTDKTFEQELKVQAEKESALVRAIISINQNRRMFQRFVDGTRNLFGFLKMQVEGEPAKLNLDQCHRYIHTIKGSCASYGMLDVQKLAHQFETKIRDLQRKGPTTLGHMIPEFRASLEIIRVHFEDFLIANAQIFGIIKSNTESDKAFAMEDLVDMSLQIKNKLGPEDSLTQKFVEKFLLERLHQLFLPFKDTVKHVAQRLEKSVEILIVQNDIKVLESHYQTFIATLDHAFRNAVDHGIEKPIERESLGKKPSGLIKITAECNSDQLQIVIADDGRGIDPDIILKTALHNQILPESQLNGMTQNELLQLVFLPGFSTQGQVTPLSGRGVGLDAIKYEATKIGGKVWIESRIGVGTELKIQLPLIRNPWTFS